MSVGFPSLNPTLRPGHVQFSGSQPSSPRASAPGADVFERRPGRPVATTSASAQAELNDKIAEELQFQLAIARAKAGLKECKKPVQSTDLAALTAEQADEFSALMAEMDHLLPQMDDMLTGLQQGKAVSPLRVSSNCSAQAPHAFQRKIAVQQEKFAQETAQLKVKQQQEREQAARQYGIQDTPELRTELLKQGIAESDLPAFLAKFGLGPKAE